MPAIIQVQLYKRSTSATLNPTYIAGFVVIGIILLAVGVWFGIRFHRKRAAAKREEARGAAFLSVRGLVKEDGSDSEKSGVNASPPNGFSRGLMNPTIVLPDKVLTRPDAAATRDEVLDFHRQSGTFPRPFAPKPFSFALSAGSSPRTSMLDPNAASDRTSMFRNSFMSATSGGGSLNRFSVVSSNSSLDSNPTSGTKRKVRQLFSPVLPDELLLTSLGEQLTVVQSFDDGWCVVGRENSTFVHTAKSLFKPAAPAPEDNVELGVVPAWCFIKPVKGLRAERPVRSTSLGITIQMEPVSARNELMSWSNF